MKKISVLIAGQHHTSITLEEEFYNALKSIAKRDNLTLNALITQIDAQRQNLNLSSAIRIYILQDFQSQLTLSKKTASK